MSPLKKIKKFILCKYNDRPRHTIASRHDWAQNIYCTTYLHGHDYTHLLLIEFDQFLCLQWKKRKHVNY